MKNSIDRIPRSIIGIVIGAGLVLTPIIAFANAQAAPTVSIGEKGNATIKNATVTVVNGSTITATTAWGGNTLTWTVTTGSSTEFLFKGGKDATPATVTVGDSINFNGALNGNGLTVAAKTVRDNSKEKQAILEKHTFEGKLNSAVGTTSLPTSFALTIGNSNFTVNVPVNTPILSKNWASVNLGSFQAGDTVRVYGSAEASNTSVIDAVVVRDATR
jgi:molybdopterin-binding protein